MPTMLPVSIEFKLPEGWQPAPPDEVGAPGVAFVALHPHPDAGFTANITIDGEYRPDEATLEEFADASVDRLREVAQAVEVAARRAIGSPDSPGLTQRLSFTALTGHVHRDLVQSHVYLSMLDIDDPNKRAVIRMVLTATAAQHDDVLENFQEFLRSVGPDSTTHQ